MAASSSSGVRKISKKPQLFINFGGEELRKGFIGHLEVALEEANINILHEWVGTKLQNLLDRIEQSMELVALVIFSKDYTNSVRCLDELVKIKECIDKGSLTGIPIFYKLKTSLVSNLEGDFGDNFRELQRKNNHDLVKTQKWEEALTFISQIKGFHLSENSDQSDIEFIKSVVEKVKSLLGEKADEMEENLKALQETMLELEDRRDVLVDRVTIEEDKGFQRLAQVQGWLSRVEIVGAQVNDLLEIRSTETERLKLKDCISSYEYGEKVLKRLEEVRELLKKGDFKEVAQKRPVPKGNLLELSESS